MDPDELAAGSPAPASPTSTSLHHRGDPARHGLPLVVLGRLVCKGGEPTPVLGCPICALITAWVATVKPVLAKQAQAQPVGDTQTETQAQKRKRPSRGTESAAGSETATL